MIPSLGSAIEIVEHVQADLSKIPQASNSKYQGPPSESDLSVIAKNGILLHVALDFFNSPEPYGLQLVCGLVQIEKIDTNADMDEDQDNLFLQAGETLDIDTIDTFTVDDERLHCIGDQNTGLYVKTISIGIAALNMGGLRVINTDTLDVVFPI